MESAGRPMDPESPDLVALWLELFSEEISSKTSTEELSPQDFVIQDTPLEGYLIDFICTTAPHLINETNINGLLRFIINEHEFRARLTSKFDAFICTNSETNGIESLVASYSKPALHCGHVFKRGDLLYSCKTCARDPSCVLCSFCFNNSVHKDHRIKLRTSEGIGGYCDCGDEESWKSGAACSQHNKHGSGNGDTSDPFSDFPADLQHRSTFVFKLLLQYFMQLLAIEENSDEIISIIPDISNVGDDKGEVHLLVLYNDESHFYGEIIHTLQRALLCDEQRAVQYADIIDKEGRTPIFKGTFVECKTLMEEVKLQGDYSLKCRIFPHSVLIHQLMALHLMSWMSNLIQLSEGFRRLFCLLTVTKISGIRGSWSVSLLETVMKRDATLWKNARQISHRLFMDNVLLDSFGKRLFAVTFARCYKEIVDCYLEDDHDLTLSVAICSVQILTVPSLAKMLLINEKLLTTILTIYLDRLQPAVGKKGTLDLSKMQDEIDFDLERLNFMLIDVFYILQYTPDWGDDETLETAFLEAFAVFVEILKLMQGMESVKRRRRGHVDYEADWEDVIALQSAMMPVIRLMIAWCSSNKDILKSAISICLSSLQECSNLKFTTKKGKNFAQHSVRKNSTSSHYELSRFLGCLLYRLSDWESDLSGTIQLHSNETVESELILIEYSLRALVLCAQVNANMWLRNGEWMKEINELYRCSRWGYDRDILMAQTVASLTDPDYFIEMLLHKYEVKRNLEKIADSNSCFRKRSNSDDDENENQKDRASIVTDFLLTVYHILSERYVIGVGEISTRDILEREIVHQLCLGPTPRSTLVAGLAIGDEDDEDDIDEEMLDDILDIVAVYREPGPKEKGAFVLKEDKWTLCNQYFIHFTKAERSKMRDEQLKVKRKTSREFESFVHPPPIFKKNFQNVNRIFCSKSFHKIIRNILARSIKKYPGYHDHIPVILTTIGLGLIESRRMRTNHESFLVDLDFVKRLLAENKKSKHSQKSTVSLIDEVLASSDSTDYHNLGKWVKRLIREETRQDGKTSTKGSESESTTDSTEDAEKAEKLRKATERKRFMMEQMRKLQMKFVQSNPEMDEITNDEGEDGSTSKSQETTNLSSPVAIGRNHSEPTRNDQLHHSCILCQSKDKLNTNSHIGDGYTSFALTTFLQKSALLDTSGKNLADDSPPSIKVNISSCGHVVHLKCWEKYFKAKKEEIEDDWDPEGNVDVENGEYTCPLCRSICNAALPLLVSTPPSENEDEIECIDTERFLSRVRTYCEKFNSISSSSIPADRESTTEIQETPTPAVEEASILKEESCTANSKKDTQICEVEQGPSERPPKSDQTTKQRISSETTIPSNVSQTFAMTLKRHFSITEENEPAPLYLRHLCHSVSHSIQSHECISRAQRRNVFATFSERQELFWMHLMKYVEQGTKEKASNLNSLIQPELQLLCDDTNALPSVINTDVFTLLVNLRFVFCDIDILQESVSTWALDDVIFKICFLAQLVKIYLTAPFFPSQEEELDERTNIVDSWIHIQNMRNASHSRNVDANALKNYVLQGLLPFLRCSTIFFRYLTGVGFPDKLTTDEDLVNMESETEILLKYLNTPGPLDRIDVMDLITSNPSIQKLVERWCAHEDVICRTPSTPTADLLYLCNASPRKLISLPKEYTAFLKHASDFYCPVLGDISRSPLLCLICNTMLCSDCYSCQRQLERSGDRGRVGACALHSIECSGDVGVFLRVRECDIALMHKANKGVLLPSLYLDEYGEYDRHLFRGNPMYLNQQRYDNLQMLWLQQKIPDTIAQNINQTPISPTVPEFISWREL